jgi:hypothetical protein
VCAWVHTYIRSASAAADKGALSSPRKPRKDALYHFPFVDETGSVDKILSGGWGHAYQVGHSKSPSLCVEKRLWSLFGVSVTCVCMHWAEGPHWSFFDMDSRGQARQAKKVSEVNPPTAPPSHSLPTHAFLRLRTRA